MVELPDMSAPLSIHDPLLHDIVQSYITRHPQDVLKMMSELPETKQSRLFLLTTPHTFVDARNEWFVTDGDHPDRITYKKQGSLEHVYKFPKDVVYRFGIDDSKYGVVDGKLKYDHISFLMIHEIKTGRYDISTEMYKHYIHDSHHMLLIWAYPYWHRRNPKPAGSYVKQMNINYLKPYINEEVGGLLKLWVGGE